MSMQLILGAIIVVLMIPIAALLVVIALVLGLIVAVIVVPIVLILFVCDTIEAIFHYISKSRE